MLYVVPSHSANRSLDCQTSLGLLVEQLTWIPFHPFAILVSVPVKIILMILLHVHEFVVRSFTACHCVYLYNEIYSGI